VVQDVKLVVHDRRVGQVGADALREGLPHVDTDGLDRGAPRSMTRCCVSRRPKI
jgi:hypothetical protein